MYVDKGCLCYVQLRKKPVLESVWSAFAQHKGSALEHGGDNTQDPVQMLSFRFLKGCNLHVCQLYICNSKLLHFKDFIVAGSVVEGVCPLWEVIQHIALVENRDPSTVHPGEEKWILRDFPLWATARRRRHSSWRTVALKAIPVPVL